MQDDQAEVIDFLVGQGGRTGTALPPIETHISKVVLSDALAWKLKRAVRLPYLDFSTPEKRLAACERELELNRRTAPTIYRATRHITRTTDGGLAFDGAGTLVDAVVEMNRFDEATLFDNLARQGRLTPPLLTELARAIARFHAGAAVDRSGAGLANIAGVLAVNHRSLVEADLFKAEDVSAWEAGAQEFLHSFGARLDARAQAGKIRRCHGDLHLRNICLVDGVPTLFDCIEFDDALATVDVLYDLAFLLMDLWHRDLKAGANLVLNRYLDVADESDGVRLLPFFMSLRAIIRAHVLASQAHGRPAAASAPLIEAARGYFQLAAALCKPVRPRLIAVGGLSGTGKSSLAAVLAAEIGAPPGARVLSSDRIRKHLHGVTAETRLPPDAYRPAVSASVYAQAAREAERLLDDGVAVVMEAVFDRVEDRVRVGELARRAGVAMTGLWLEAPEQVLVNRIEARRGDASDANVAVVHAQLARAPKDVTWHRLDAARPLALVADEARQLLR